MRHTSCLTNWLHITQLLCYITHSISKAESLVMRIVTGPRVGSQPRVYQFIFYYETLGGTNHLNSTVFASLRISTANQSAVDSCPLIRFCGRVCCPKATESRRLTHTNKLLASAAFEHYYSIVVLERFCNFTNWWLSSRLWCLRC